MSVDRPKKIKKKIGLKKLSLHRFLCPSPLITLCSWLHKSVETIKRIEEWTKKSRCHSFQLRIFSLSEPCGASQMKTIRHFSFYRHEYTKIKIISYSLFLDFFKITWIVVSNLVRNSIETQFHLVEFGAQKQAIKSKKRDRKAMKDKLERAKKERRGKKVTNGFFRFFSIFFVRIVMRMEWYFDMFYICAEEKKKRRKISVLIVSQSYPFNWIINLCWRTKKNAISFSSSFSHHWQLSKAFIIFPLIFLHFT